VTDSSGRIEQLETDLKTATWLLAELKDQHIKLATLIGAAVAQQMITQQLNTALGIPTPT
jgi:hypothetical protein